MNQKPLMAFTVGPEDIFAATDQTQAMHLANEITKPVPVYGLHDVEPIESNLLNVPWGDSAESLQQRLDALNGPGYLAGWQD